MEGWGGCMDGGLRDEKRKGECMKVGGKTSRDGE